MQLKSLLLIAFLAVEGAHAQVQEPCTPCQLHVQSAHLECKNNSKDCSVCCKGPICQGRCEDYKTASVRATAAFPEDLYPFSLNFSFADAGDQRNESGNGSTGTFLDDLVFGSYCKFCKILTLSTLETGGTVFLPILANESDTQCRQNATGFMCGHCAPGLYHSREGYCIECDNLALNWFFFFLLILFMTAVFFIIYLSGVNLVEGGLNSAIFFSQMIVTSMNITANGYIPISNITKDPTVSKAILDAYYFLYDIWNLEFFSPFSKRLCLFHSDKYLYYFLVEYFIAFYPLILLTVGILIRRLNARYHFYNKIRCLKCIRINETDESTYAQNLVASIFLLSYTKLALTTTSLLFPIQINNGTSYPISQVSSFDPTVEYDSGHYIIILVFASIIASVLILFPIFLSLQRYKIPENGQPLSWSSAFLLPFQSPFKDACGKDDCRRCRDNNLVKWKFSLRIHDYRWVSALYFLLRLALLFVSYGVPYVDQFQKYLIQQVICIFGGMIILFLQPYSNHKSSMNRVDMVFLFLLAFINSLTIYQYYLTISGQSLSSIAFAVQYILVFVPFGWMVCYFGRIVITKIKKVVKKNFPAVNREEQDIARRENIPLVVSGQY